MVADEEFKAVAEAASFPCTDVAVDGEVIEADPPRRLITTWRILVDPTCMAEGFTVVTHEIHDFGNGSCKLTRARKLDASHSTIGELVSGRMHAGGEGGGGGYAWVLSDLKSLLETGVGLTG